MRASMEVGIAPSFPDHISSHELEDGALELVCPITADPKPDIKWFFEAEELFESEKCNFRVQEMANDRWCSFLIVRNLTDDDSGDYKCVGSNPHGEGTATFTVNLTGFSAPTFVKEPMERTSDDGKILLLDFRVKSTVPPTFLWEKLNEDEERRPVQESTRLELILKEEPNCTYYVAIAFLNPNKKQDGGHYECIVANDFGKLKARITLQSQRGAPKLTRKSQVTQKHESDHTVTVFNIGFRSEYSYDIDWFDPSEKRIRPNDRFMITVFPDQDEFTYTADFCIKNATVDDSGVYRFVIRNDQGDLMSEITLTIEAPDDIGEETTTE